MRSETCSRSGAIEGEAGVVGPSHGDFAPWNLLVTGKRAVLVDWESATANGAAFHDVCHWLVQAHSLLGNPSHDDLLAGLQRGEGWVGAALEGYADGAGVSPADAVHGMTAYLRARRSTAAPQTRRDHEAILGRYRLLQTLEA